MASVLVTGRGTSGSWQVRGVQLGKAIGAQVEAQALKPHDGLAIGVKRVPSPLSEAHRGRLIWDVVDAYPQPLGNDWTEAQCKEWLRSEMARIQPIGVIAATKKMAEDLAGFDVPVLWLPHHHRPGIERNPIRERVEVIGYEGSPQYIEAWRPTIERECKRIGAKFILNPPRLADLDVVLALRGSRGYAPRSWKSGVKMANAHGSGTPFIGSPEAGYVETATGAEYWADSPAEFAMALGHLASRERRMQVRERFLKSAFTLDQAAEKLKTWLATI